MACRMAADQGPVDEAQEAAGLEGCGIEQGFCKDEGGPLRLGQGPEGPQRSPASPPDPGRGQEHQARKEVAQILVEPLGSLGSRWNRSRKNEDGHETRRAETERQTQPVGRTVPAPQVLDQAVHAASETLIRISPKVSPWTRAMRPVRTSSSKARNVSTRSSRVRAWPSRPWKGFHRPSWRLPSTSITRCSSVLGLSLIHI